MVHQSQVSILWGKHDLGACGGKHISNRPRICVHAFMPPSDGLSAFSRDLTATLRDFPFWNILGKPSSTSQLLQRACCLHFFGHLCKDLRDEWQTIEISSCRLARSSCSFPIFIFFLLPKMVEGSHSMGQGLRATPLGVSLRSILMIQGIGLD